MSFTENQQGQILSRTVSDGTTASGKPTEYHYDFGGIAVGDISNNGNPDLFWGSDQRRQRVSGSACPLVLSS